MYYPARRAAHSCAVSLQALERRGNSVRKAAVVVLLVAGLIGGCAKERRAEAGSTELAPYVDLGLTIASLAEVVMPEPTAVDGYGVIGGLRGTGSAECPPQVRTYLRRYVPTQVPEAQVDVDKFIDSPNTAVIWLEGFMPPGACKGQRFDVRVVALRGTQTTSLDGGWLYTAELWPRGSFGVGSTPIAIAEGPVFIDTISTAQPNNRIGYVLSGGTAMADYRVGVVLRKPDYRAASAIRNKINERFGPDVAQAISSGQIELRIPQRYAERRIRFIEIVRATYLDETEGITQERVRTFVRQLAVSADKHSSEIALEAIGKASLSKLGVLLNSSNEEVRLRAGRCMLNLGSDRGFEVLRAIAIDPNGTYRIDALEAIVGSAKPDDASVLATTLLRDRDMTVMLAAYEQLRKLADAAVSREFVGRSFHLEQTPQTQHKAVFVTRMGPPRIVLFGAPLYCQGDVFIQSPDASVVIDSRAGQDYVSVTRKHPSRPAVLGSFQSSRDLGDIIKTLCGEPAAADKRTRGGLGVSYADMIALVKQMCEKDAVRAEFWAGPLPEIGLPVKK